MAGPRDVGRIAAARRMAQFRSSDHPPKSRAGNVSVGLRVNVAVGYLRGLSMQRGLVMAMATVVLAASACWSSQKRDDATQEAVRASSAGSPADAPSQTPGDARRDGVVPAVARLQFAARVRVLQAVSTPEGVWAISRLPPQSGDPRSGSVGSGWYGKTMVNASDYGEVLLLDQGRQRILRAYPAIGVPPQRLLLTRRALFCQRQGDGGLPDSMLCRIDRSSFHWRLRVFPSRMDSAFGPSRIVYTPSNWKISQPVNAPIFQHLRMTDGKLVTSGSGKSADVDLSSLRLDCRGGASSCFDD